MTSHIADTFYTAFSNGDAEAMVACYAEDIVFEDPAFGELRGKDAGDMWRMLIAAGSDMTLTYEVLSASDTSARVKWVALYTFSATGRHVRNEVTATMKITEGKILDHRDSFDFWAWSRQALGVPGVLLGWSPMLKSKVRSTATGNLSKFQATAK